MLEKLRTEVVSGDSGDEDSVIRVINVYSSRWLIKMVVSRLCKGV